MKATYTPIGIVILAIITLFTSPLLYADNQSIAPANNQSDPGPHISLSFAVHERYLANRISRQLNDEPSLWTQANIKWNSGWYANWLEIHGLNDSTWSNNSADETQVTIGKNWKVWDLDIKAEATLINIHPISAWFEHDRLSVDVYVSKPISLSAKHTITPELRFIWFADTSDIESGVPIAMLSVNHTWKQFCGRSDLSLKTRLTASWDGGLYADDASVVMGQFDTSLNWKISAQASLQAGIKLFQPFTHNVSDGRDGLRSSFYVGTSVSF
jgi:hypothetical protein